MGTRTGGHAPAFGAALRDRDGVLGAVGGTPLVPLRRVLPDADIELHGKLEMLNPGGSLKDRPALNMLRTAWADGLIDEDTTIVESSSGNLGVALSQVCAVLGLPLICVVDPLTNDANIAMMEAYGTTVELVAQPDPVTKGFLQARINRVHTLLGAIPGSFWCNQYANLANAGAHHETMREVLADLGHVDFFFCATSSCGTLRGVSDFVADHGLATQVIAVDAVGSVIFGGAPRSRLIPGHGAARVPELYRTGLEHGHVHIDDPSCVTGCRRLLQREGIMAGGSSGAVIAAIDDLADALPSGATVVALLADRGERYLETVYSDEWVRRHLGELPILFDSSRRRAANAALVAGA